MATVASCSGRGVQKAKKVKAVAPDLAAKVMTGQLSLDAAYTKAQAVERDNRQKEPPPRPVGLSGVRAPVRMGGAHRRSSERSRLRRPHEAESARRRRPEKPGHGAAQRVPICAPPRQPDGSSVMHGVV
jgi:hypothetical protein